MSCTICEIESEGGAPFALGAVWVVIAAVRRARRAGRTWKARARARDERERTILGPRRGPCGGTVSGDSTCGRVACAAETGPRRPRGSTRGRLDLERRPRFQV